MKFLYRIPGTSDASGGIKVCRMQLPHVCKNVGIILHPGTKVSPNFKESRFSNPISSVFNRDIETVTLKILKDTVLSNRSLKQAN